MHNSVAAIRAARVTARFVLPAANQRQRTLGLHRVAFTPVRQGSGRLGRGSLEAALGIGSGLVPAPVRRVVTSPLRPAPRMTWSHGGGVQARRSPSRRATPWRG
jgi:hypothetical protein